jgi:hypothetical protein
MLSEDQVGFFLVSDLLDQEKEIKPWRSWRLGGSSSLIENNETRER